MKAPRQPRGVFVFGARCATRLVRDSPTSYAETRNNKCGLRPRSRRTLMRHARLLSGFAATAIAACLFSAATAHAQPPAAGPAQDLLSKVARQTQSSFCKSQGLMACLKLDRAECEKRIGPIMRGCLRNPGAAQSIQNENFVRGVLLGCVLSSFLSGNPHATEATACIQRAGKR